MDEGLEEVDESLIHDIGADEEIIGVYGVKGRACHISSLGFIVRVRQIGF